MKNSRPKSDTIETLYRHRYDEVLKPLASALDQHLVECFKGKPRIDRISARAKDVDSFVNKANKCEGDTRKYSEPFEQIQDQIGARIVTFYRTDIDNIATTVLKYFTAIEEKDRVPDSQWEFGYFGKHYILVIPSDIIDDKWDTALIPKFFELQIKTLFQHAWSEAEHDLGYKQGQTPLDHDQTRRLAFTSAQAWGADRVFAELFEELSQSAAVAK